jgi:hypothetical protein
MVNNEDIESIINKDFRSTVLFHRTRLFQMESSFNMVNSYFILAETLIIISYVTSLTSQTHLTIFKMVLVAGFVFSVFWTLINIQYFQRYIDEHNLMVQELEVIISNQSAYKKLDFWENWKSDYSFWAFLITPLFFELFNLILLIN